MEHNDAGVSQVYINKNFQCKIVNISYPSILTYVLGAQKNRLIEMVLLSTHNICFGLSINGLVTGGNTKLCC